MRLTRVLDHGPEGIISEATMLWGQVLGMLFSLLLLAGTVWLALIHRA